MGGLRKYLPLTHACFLVACLAIAGIPPFAGFFSKEEMLFASFNANKIIYTVALLTSSLTAFYMFRLYFLIFWHKDSLSANAHASEGGLAMKLPLLLLTICTIGAGFIHFGSFVYTGSAIENGPALFFAVLPVVLAVSGILLAAILYRKANNRPAKISTTFAVVYNAARRKFYIDEIYLFITKQILFNLIGRPAAWIDKHIVDGLMNGIAASTAKLSAAIKGVQSGRLQGYMLYFFAGIAGLAIVFVWWYR